MLPPFTIILFSYVKIFFYSFIILKKITYLLDFGAIKHELILQNTNDK